MRTITHTRTFADTCPDRLFDLLTEFSDYPDATDAVRSVDVEERADGTTVSEWAVDFRGGVLCWSEVDEIDADARTIEFDQLAGDMASFDGAWSVDTGADGTTVTFDASFDLGIPSLADLLEPVAENALIENVDNIIDAMATAASDAALRPAA